MLVRRIEVQFESAIHMRIISILLTIICVLYVIMNSMSLNTETWEKKGTYRNGYLLNFVLGIRDSFVKAPDAYSKAAVDKIAGNFKETDSSYSQSDAKNPTIIVIMNESFADLSVVGDFKTNTQVTPFMDSLSENTLKAMLFRPCTVRRRQTLSGNLRQETRWHFCRTARWFISSI